LELFSLAWDDLKLMRPENGSRVGLAPGIGVMELRSNSKEDLTADGLTQKKKEIPGRKKK
jgi:hypothetical protein